jgi:hypothetical protein
MGRIAIAVEELAGADFPEPVTVSAVHHLRGAL